MDTVLYVMIEGERVRLLKMDAATGKDVVGITKRSDRSPFVHCHEFIQINYITKGKIVHRIKDMSFEAVSGDIFVIPPFVPHIVEPIEGSPFEIIEIEFIAQFVDERYSNYLDRSFMDFAYLEPFLVIEKQMRPRLSLSGSVKRTVDQLVGEALEEYCTRLPDYEIAMKAILLKLLIVVGREYNRQTKGEAISQTFERHRAAIMEAQTFIEENYDKDIKLTQVAGIALLSTSYFRYLFKQLTGETFIEHINRKRVLAAAEYIQKDPDARIIEVCHKVGFNNINHFNRVFKQIIDASPKELRPRNLPRVKEK